MFEDLQGKKQLPELIWKSPGFLHSLMIKCIGGGDSKMTQQVKVLEAEPDSLSSVLGTNLVRKERIDSYKLSFDFH